MNIAVVFPGQGSQSLGMLSGFTENWPQVLETFKEASDVLGYDLWDIVSNGPVEKLNQTEITQPAVLTADIAVMRVMAEQCMIKPFALAGHSLGEYAALVVANAIEFKDAVKLVAERGRLMQAAVPEGEGAMAAILNVADSELIAVCEKAATETGECVEAVNFNAPGQVVIAGSSAAVDRAIELAKEAGAKRALKLPVSVPSHSSLMKPAADELAKVLADVEIKTPEIQVIHNVDAKSHDEPDAIRDAFQAMIEGKINATIECNPLLGPQFFELALKVTNGEDVPKWVPSEEDIFFPDDAAKILPSRRY